MPQYFRQKLDRISELLKQRAQSVKLLETKTNDLVSTSILFPCRSPSGLENGASHSQSDEVASTSKEIQASTIQEIKNDNVPHREPASTSQNTQASPSHANEASTIQEMKNDNEPEASNEPESPTSRLHDDAGQSVSIVALRIKTEPGEPVQGTPLRKHRFTVRTRGNNKYYCTCGIGFQRRNKLDLHIDFWNKTYKNTIRISDCNSSEADKRARRVRKNGSAAYKKFACDLCEERFVGVSLLKTHKAKAHGVTVDRRFEIGCRLCGAVFPSRVEFSLHRINVQRICQRNAPRGDQLLHQLVPHQVEDRVSNNFAQQAVPSASWKQHSIDKSKPAILGHFSTCGYKCLTPASLMTHILAQTVQRKKTCKTCAANFSSDISLQQHMARFHNVAFGGNKEKETSRPIPLLLWKSILSQANAG